VSNASSTATTVGRPPTGDEKLRGRAFREDYVLETSARVAGRLCQPGFHNCESTLIPCTWLQDIWNRLGEIDHDAND